jgi:hypothetical protein
MRLSSLNALNVSSRRNVLLTNEEAECGAVTADDLGKIINHPLNLYMYIEAEDDDG